MIPEFLGRLPVLFTLDALDKDMYIKILKEPKNAILKQYKKLLALDEVDLEFDDSAYEAIAEKAMEKKTGARALRAIIEDFMLLCMRFRATITSVVSPSPAIISMARAHRSSNYVVPIFKRQDQEVSR